MRLTWKQVALVEPSQPVSKPQLLLDESLSDLANLHLHCSISHDGDYVVASVVAEMRFNSST